MPHGSDSFKHQKSVENCMIYTAGKCEMSHMATVKKIIVYLFFSGSKKWDELNYGSYGFI